MRPRPTRKEKGERRKESKIGAQTYICRYIHAVLSKGAVVACHNNATLISVYCIKL